jgi:hypothetical protein
MNHRTGRRGYALVIVIAFMTLLFSLSALVYSHLGAALRVELVQSAQKVRDEGAMHALAQALALLQTGTPPSNPYEGGVTIETSAGTRAFTVTMSSDDGLQWTIHVALTPDGESPEPMPSAFSPPPTE